jgi:peroxiredoxin Q/BCP
MLNIGTTAPDFALPDQNGETRKLSDFSGQRVILYFYSKDMTSGCSKQACGFAELYPHFREKGAVVIGVSKDSAKSHTGFRAKYELPFRLLADTSTEMLQSFGAWGEKKMYGKTVLGTLRRTFIFSEDGILERVIEKVDTKNAAGQILEG